jgi:hypothetical protein
MAVLGLSTAYGRSKIAKLKESHPLKAEYIDRRVERHLADANIASSDDEFVDLLENEIEPRLAHASQRPMKGKKVRGTPSRRS